MIMFLYHCLCFSVEPVAMFTDYQALSVDKNDVVFSLQVKCITDGGELTTG